MGVISQSKTSMLIRPILTRRATVLVFLPVVDEVCLIESAVGLSVGCPGSRHQHGSAGLFARQNFLAIEVAAISDCNQRSCPDCGASLLCHARQLITVAADVGYLVFDDRNLTRLKVGFDSTLPFVEGL